MPEPIIEPITSVVALVRPKPFTNSWSCWLELLVFCRCGLAHSPPWQVSIRFTAISSSGAPIGTKSGEQYPY